MLMYRDEWGAVGGLGMGGLGMGALGMGVLERVSWYRAGQGFDADVGFRNAAQRSCAAVILYNSVRRGGDPSIICTGSFARTVFIRKCGTCGKC